ncbi:hypothetical protein UVI_02062420 [Ustilaginoidea virens]|uniref:Actin lateral binding protein n=1 Tax=Ustilaginoidea virens TaxID=1159556 RepID=A0A1B5L6Q7_USTVR|nr:hypothetical protein UVI_02062420 [Ustilaginoidea virens]
MDRIKDKLNALSSKADSLEKENDSLRAEVRQLNQDLAAKVALIETLHAKVQAAERALDAADDAAEEVKRLVAKLNMLEIEADKYVPGKQTPGSERQIKAIEAERDSWEKKYEEQSQKHLATRKELDELALHLENL